VGIVGVHSLDVLDVEAVEAVEVIEGVRRCECFPVVEIKVGSTGLDEMVGSGAKGRLMTS